MRYALPGFVLLACAGLILPIVIVLVLAFSGGTFLKFPPDTYSLRCSVAFLDDACWRASHVSSLQIGIIACLVATTIGFMAAYALSRSRVPAKRLILSVSLLPIIAPTIITSIAMYYASARLGLI